MSSDLCPQCLFILKFVDEDDVHGVGDVDGDDES